MLRVHVGATAQQVDLYHRFDDSENAHEISHICDEILRAVRTEADIRAAKAAWLSMVVSIKRCLRRAEESQSLSTISSSWCDASFCWPPTRCRSSSSCWRCSKSER